MSLCINPSCNCQNPETELFCLQCNSELLLLGRYRIIQYLGGGGFGKTYKISHNNSIKLLKILLTNQPIAVDLFKREADVLQQLNYSGIPKGDEYFTFLPKGTNTLLHCQVMEFIHGKDLEVYIKQRGNQPIDQRLAIDWLIAVTTILDTVHQQNFFHRDIKPSNIMLKPDGQLALIDFGAVRVISPTIHAGGRNTGIYTPGYAAPEQEKGHAIPKSDFFALGRTFVYLLTAKHPLDPEIYDPNTDRLHWRKFAPNIAPQLADFLDEMMAHSANQRPENSGIILQRLKEIQNHLYLAKTIPQPPQGKNNYVNNLVQPSRRKFIGLVGLASGGLVAGLIISKFNTKSAINLEVFEFEVITVDAYGNENNRSRQQAKFFKEDLGNGVFLEMVYIPGGTFMMGSSDREKKRRNREIPQHRVSISSFYMGKFTVTQKQWEAVMHTNPSRFKGENKLPVETVSWHDAQEFCSRISKKTGRNYLLPSEAQWEYACRAGSTTPFHFGETITTDLANYYGDTYALESKGIYRKQTTLVGSFPPNTFGLYDMHGNVWEWCADIWHDSYNGAPTDGSVWDFGGDSKYRLMRGGSWSVDAQSCRSAYRDNHSPAIRFSNVGFRVVCIGA